MASIYTRGNYYGSSGVKSFKGRSGSILPMAGDYDSEQIDYDKTSGALKADDVEEAINELTTKTVTFALSVGSSTSKKVPGVNSNMVVVAYSIADPSKVTSSTITVTTSDYNGSSNNVVVTATVTAATNITLTFAPSKTVTAS